MRTKSLDRHITQMLLVGTRGAKGHANALATMKIDEACIIREDAADGVSFKLTFERELDGVIVRVISSAYAGQLYTDKYPRMNISTEVQIDVPFGSGISSWSDDTRIDYHTSMYSRYVHEDDAFELLLIDMHRALASEQERWIHQCGEWANRSFWQRFWGTLDD